MTPSGPATPPPPPRPPRLPPLGPLGWLLAALGLGALVAGAAVIAALVLLGLLLAPLVVWLSWNVLDFAHAIGAPELGLWGILLLALFLVAGFGGRLLIALIVALIDPAWLSGSARLHWPDPSVRTFVALALLLAVASLPRHHGRSGGRAHKGEE
jgi:hypothetical protein